MKSSVKFARSLARCAEGPAEQLRGSLHVVVDMYVRAGQMKLDSKLSPTALSCTHDIRGTAGLSSIFQLRQHGTLLAYDLMIFSISGAIAMP